MSKKKAKPGREVNGHKIVRKETLSYTGEEVIHCSCGTKCRYWMGGDAMSLWELHAWS